MYFNFVLIICAEFYKVASLLSTFHNYNTVQLNENLLVFFIQQAYVYSYPDTNAHSYIFFTLTKSSISATSCIDSFTISFISHVLMNIYQTSSLFYTSFRSYMTQWGRQGNQLRVWLFRSYVGLLRALKMYQMCIRDRLSVPQ